MFDRDNQKIINADKYIPAFTMKYLSEADQLNLRATSRSYRRILQRKQAAPYRTKMQFVMGMTGQFNKDLSAHLDAAWGTYQLTITSDSLKPALLYKLIDDSYNTSFQLRLDRFREFENIYTNGRRYNPSHAHFWAYNQVWMLAQIHKGRSFTILSNLSDEHLIRRKFHDTYSAFAKEIAAAMRAGYTPGVTANGDLQLLPPDKNLRVKTTVTNIHVSDDQIKISYLWLREYGNDQHVKPYPSRQAQAANFVYQKNDGLRMVLMPPEGTTVDLSTLPSGVTGALLNIGIFAGSANTNSEIAAEPVLKKRK